MSDVKWIKITTDIFDDEKILLIESLPDAQSIIVIWFKLLCLAGKMNNSGVFMLNDKIAYTDKMLATIFRMNEATVTLALDTFEQFGMIEIIDGVITIPNWGKHQSLEQLAARKEYQKEYQREYRKKQKEIADNKCLHKHLRKHLCNDDVNSLEEDIEEDIERDTDTDKEVVEVVASMYVPESVEPKKSKPSYEIILDMYHNICKSLPKVKMLTDERIYSINNVLEEYDYKDIEDAFVKANESDFLKGNNAKGWQANFDWLMDSNNLIKVLEDKYINREPKPKPAAVPAPKPVTKSKFAHAEERQYTKEFFAEIDKKASTDPWG